MFSHLRNPIRENEMYMKQNFPNSLSYFIYFELFFLPTLLLLLLLLAAFIVT